MEYANREEALRYRSNHLLTDQFPDTRDRWFAEICRDERTEA